MKDLPIYDITIEDDAEIQGVSKISLVDVPAIGVNWIALRKVELKLQDVFGYETQNFDICPGAQATFKNYSEMQLDEDTIGMIRSAAQNADNVFEIEKRVIASGKATREDLEQVRILVADFKDIISEIDKITGQPQNVDYMDGHIKVVEDLMPKTMMAVRMRKRKMVLVKKECLACPPNGDGTRVNGEPDRRCKGDGAEKTPKGGGRASAKPAEKSSSKSKSLDPKSVPVEVQSLTDFSKWSEEQKAYWNDEKNVQAVVDKNAELEQQRTNLAAKVQEHNDKLKQLNKDRLSFQPGVRESVPRREEEIRAERRQLEAQAKSITEDEQKMHRINSVLQEGGKNPFAGSERGDKLDEVVRSRAERVKEIEKAQEAERKIKAITPKQADARANAAQKKIDNAGFEKPATAKDYATLELPNAVRDLQNMLEKNTFAPHEIRNAIKKVEDLNQGRTYGGARVIRIDGETETQSRAAKAASDDYDEHIQREIDRLPTKRDRYGEPVPKGSVREDRTWDYAKGEPTKPPRAGMQRRLGYEERSWEDINEGYPAYKIVIRWE